jgi:hypothetical protein
MTTQSREPSDTDALVLAPLTPDRFRAARTRQRCGAALSVAVRRRQRRADLRARALDTLTPVMVAACGLLYAATLVANTLRLEALLR